MNSTLVIASSTKDYEELENHNLLEGIKEAFGASEVKHCTSADELTKLSRVVDFILYFNSFKDLSYSRVLNLAKSSSTIDNILGIEASGNKLWLYNNKGVIANYVEPSGLVDAIHRSLHVSNTLPQAGNYVLAFLLLIFITISVWIHLDTKDSQKVYAEPIQVAEPQQTHYDFNGNVIK